MTRKRTPRPAVRAGMLNTIMLLLLLGACEDECRNLPNAITCEDDGTCWARHPDWDVPAQAFDWDGLNEGLEGGVFEPAEPPAPALGVECWRYGEPMTGFAHTCVIPTTCYDLHARPLAEIAGLTDDPCGAAMDGPWDYTAESLFGCVGVFVDLELAVRLDA